MEEATMKYTIHDDQIKYIREELEPIVKKTGPFKIDPQEFAWSVMESSTEHANNILKILEAIEKETHS